VIDELKPYPSYTNTSLQWAPRLPSHWDIKRGKALFAESQLPVDDSDEIVTCFRDGQVTLRKNRRTRGFMEALYEVGYQGVRKGQLVIHAMDAFAGAIGVSDSDGKCTPEYVVCDPRSNSVVPGYYALTLRFAAHQGFILASCPAVRERAPRFRYSHFGDMQLPLPPREEQEAIVGFLDLANRQIERYIRAKRKLIALLNEQKQGIVQGAVTRGIDSGVPLRDSGVKWLGKVPCHWKVLRIKHVLREVDRRSTTGRETLLSLRMHHGLVPFAEHFTRPPQAATLVGFKIVRDGELVINRMQAGNGLIYPSNIAGLVSPDYAVFDPIGDVNVRFLGELFRCQKLRTKFRAESKGLGTGTSGFLRLYNDRLGAIHISLPPQQEQEAILRWLDDRLSGLNAAIVDTEREITLMHEYRERLVSDVAAGQFDVRTAARALPDHEPVLADEDEPFEDSATAENENDE
jgi:type I restriction enzyme S subunit